MDLLNSITEELQGRSEPESRDDRPEQRSSDDRRPERGRSDDRRPERGRSDDRRPHQRARDDEHVCAFCETGFDASRRTCPDCGAEIVVRGRR